MTEPDSAGKGTELESVRMASPVCCPRTTRPPPLRSCARSSCRASSGRRGQCGACSPTAAPSSRRRLMLAVVTSACRTHEPNRVTLGPTASWNACRARLWRTLARGARRRYVTTRAALPARPRRLHAVLQHGAPASKAIASAAVRQRRWFGAWRLSERIQRHHHSGPAEVSTPFRVWTAGV
jgi:hypothetical protein